jgi:ABC-type Fe3+ transport system permease subunit
LIAFLGLTPIRNFFQIDLSSATISLIGLFAAIFMIFFGSFYGRILFGDDAQ